MAGYCLCENVLAQIGSYLFADVYRCFSDGWRLAYTQSLHSINTSYYPAQQECAIKNKCLNPCPINKKRFKNQFCRYTEGNYTIEKLVVFFEEAILTDEQIAGENFIDVVFSATIKIDANNNIVERKIETIWGTGGHKIIVRWKQTPIFSVLVNRVKDNILLS